MSQLRLSGPWKSRWREYRHPWLLPHEIGQTPSISVPRVRTDVLLHQRYAVLPAPTSARSFRRCSGSPGGPGADRARCRRPPSRRCRAGRGWCTGRAEYLGRASWESRIIALDRSPPCRRPAGARGPCLFRRPSPTDDDQRGPVGAGRLRSAGSDHRARNGTTRWRVGWRSTSWMRSGGRSRGSGRTERQVRQRRSTSARKRPGSTLSALVTSRNSITSSRRSPVRPSR